MRIINSRIISKGVASGKALVSNSSLSFFGGVDPSSGIIIDKGNSLIGKSIEGRILIFSRGKGSTVGSYVIYQLAKNKKAPAAIICLEADPIVAVGAIIAEIPMVDKPESFNFKDDQQITVDGQIGQILVEE
jgi:predicted aconitase with swiveling domain